MAQDARQSIDYGQGDLVGTEPEDAPAAEARLDVFLQVGVETSGAVVASIDPDAALDLDEATARQLRARGGGSVLRDGSRVSWRDRVSGVSPSLIE